ncbi:uncharacterized protein LOC124613273 [Schistocerca americana]|uniref:uncharacterized protein LOC124613273 n=1 Tax=Schistocerca americana TaxID=7009 RepID=UPI001F503FAF|nr:uncharacterized protein LOC124613273 [Schistocerca americana]
MENKCRVLDQQVTHHVEKITGLQQLVQQLTKHETRRKRGVFNFVGQVSKILFGTLDEADAAYYKERIDAMEKNSEGLLRLTKEQVAVVRATLAGVESNEHILRTGMQRLERFMKEYVKETDLGFKRVATFATVTEQVLQLAAVFGQIEEEYEQMINAIVNAQKGILQPHIINPVQIVKYLSLIRDELKDVKFPVPLAESSRYLLLRIIDLDVFISGSILGYVINIPLIGNNNFNLYRVLPLPKEIPNMKGRYIYIQPEKEFLLIDESKRQYAKLSADDLKCKELSKNKSLCRQSFALLSTFDHEECEAKLLQPVREIPEDCVRKILALNQSLLTHLNSNEWLYVAPKEEGLTVLCGKEPPKDLLMKGVGKISFYSKYKGYGTMVFIQTDRVIHSNVTKKDIIPQINLEFDCCVVNEEKKNVSMLTLDLPLEQVVTQLNDLKVAGKRLDDVQRMAERQEEELKYSRYFTHYSMQHAARACISQCQSQTSPPPTQLCVPWKTATDANLSPPSTLATRDAASYSAVPGRRPDASECSLVQCRAARPEQMARRGAACSGSGDAEAEGRDIDSGPRRTQYACGQRLNGRRPREGRHSSR